MSSHIVLFALLIFASTVLMANESNHLAAVGTSSSSSAPAEHKKVKPYQQLLESLQSNETVLPVLPDLHPARTVYNNEAIIPPQCYTRTEGKHNPCYVCHQNSVEGRENVMSDEGLQRAYSFSELGMKNHWKNLFEDRSERVSKISDAQIIDWINQDNYSELASRLKEAEFQGWIPDIKNLHLSADAFDDEGFAKDGSHWVAFNYKPFPSTFWPTNGSTDDVMIRLPKAFRTDKEGKYNHDIYKANLAILEANFKGFDSIDTLPIDETSIDADLDSDGKLSVANHINKVTQYYGAADNIRPQSYQYPKDTEFLHTVRYIGLDDDKIKPSTRMKEVRYMRKWQEFGKDVYARYYQMEGFEKEAGNLPRYHYLAHNGLDNGFGWSIQGFIEDKNGRLRQNTHEENLFCMGCHTSIGSTIDKTFSFARKVDGTTGWGYIDLKGMPDAPNIGESLGEIATYFQRAGGGDEFRSNTEMFERWFNKDGSVNISKVTAAADVYDLITPTKERALQLNKAYKIIVEDQNFIFGRDATATPPKNVLDHIDNENATTLPESRTYQWDIRLDWNKAKNGTDRYTQKKHGL